MVARIHPASIALFVMGIFFMAVPPIGILLMIASVVMQKSYRGRVRTSNREVLIKAATQQRREKILAARSLR